MVQISLVRPSKLVSTRSTHIRLFLRVHHLVVFEMVRSDEQLSTLEALERPLARMCPPVVVEVDLLPELLATFDALKGFCSSVNAHMGAQRLGLTETFATVVKLTPEWFFVGVCSLVKAQVARPCENFAAECTLMLAVFSLVHAHVSTQSPELAETPVAPRVLTGKRLLFRVRPLMEAQLTRPGKHPQTAHTLVLCTLGHV